MSAYSNIGDQTSSQMMARMVNDESVRGLVMSRVCENIYYDKGSVATKSQCDTVKNSRFTQGGTSLALGSSSIFQIPNMSILEACVLRMQLPAIPNNVSINRGWAYALVQRVDLRLSSSITLSFSGTQLLTSVLAKSETVSKRSEILRLGGDAVSGPSAAAVEGFVILSLPGLTVANALNKAKLPIDLKMFAALPVQIIVYLNPGSYIYGGSAAATASNSLSQFEMTCSQLDFKDSSHSLSTDLRMNPMGQYVSPFGYEQHLQVPIASLSASATAPTTINLTGFRSGELTGIGMTLVLDTSLNPVPANDSKNPFDFQRIENITLFFNGLIFAKLNSRIFDVLQMTTQLDGNYVENNRITGAASPFTSTAVNSYYYFLDLAQHPALLNEGTVQSGLSVGSNVLQLSFTSPGNAGLSAQLYITYVYNAGIKVSQGGAQVDYVF